MHRDKRFHVFCSDDTQPSICKPPAPAPHMGHAFVHMGMAKHMHERVARTKNYPQLVALVQHLNTHATVSGLTDMRPVLGVMSPLTCCTRSRRRARLDCQWTRVCARDGMAAVGRHGGRTSTSVTKLFSTLENLKAANSGQESTNATQTRPTWRRRRRLRRACRHTMGQHDLCY